MTINLSKCLVQSMKLSRLISFFRTHTNRYKENAISKNILGNNKKKQRGIYTLFMQPNRRDNVYVDKQELSIVLLYSREILPVRTAMRKVTTDLLLAKHLTNMRLKILGMAMRATCHM